VYMPLRKPAAEALQVEPSPLASDGAVSL
jgi:hypothetical protein